MWGKTSSLRLSNPQMGSQVTEQLHRDTGIFIGVLAQSGVTVKVIYPSGLKSSHRMAQGEKNNLQKLHHNSVFWPSDSS